MNTDVIRWQVAKDGRVAAIAERGIAVGHARIGLTGRASTGYFRAMKRAYTFNQREYRPLVAQQIQGVARHIDVGNVVRVERA